MKKVLILGLAAGMVLAFTMAVAQTTKSGEVKDSFVIEAKIPAGEKLTKPGVGFTHKKHTDDYKVACAECHHVYKDGKNTWKEGDKVDTCASCHLLKPKSTKKGEPGKLQTAMHDNCQKCHKELEKGGKKTGPTKTCNDCHTGKAPK